MILSNEQHQRQAEVKTKVERGKESQRAYLDNDRKKGENKTRKRKVTCHVSESNGIESNHEDDMSGA